MIMCNMKETPYRFLRYAQKKEMQTDEGQMSGVKP